LSGGKVSADNGFVLRINDEGKYALQEYSVSASEYPRIEDAAMVFDTVEEAVRKFSEISAEPMRIIEYGLTVILEKPWSEIWRDAGERGSTEPV
jgi:hypothetical protein